MPDDSDDKKKTLNARYRDLLVRWPLLANGLYSSTLTGAADLVTQVATHDFATGSFRPAPIRTLRLMTIGLCVITPAAKWCNDLVNGLHIGTAGKMLVDQSICAVFLHSLFNSAFHILSGNSPAGIPAVLLSAAFRERLFASYYLWVPAKFLMFAIVPPTFQLQFQSTVAFVWNVWLSKMINRA